MTETDYLLEKKTEGTGHMSSKSGDKLTKSKVLIFFFNTYKLHNFEKLEHIWHSVYYSDIISYNREMKWIRYNKETTSYNYEMKFHRFHILMKEFIALLKNEILPMHTVIMFSVHRVTLKSGCVAVQCKLCYCTVNSVLC